MRENEKDALKEAFAKPNGFERIYMDELDKILNEADKQYPERVGENKSQVNPQKSQEEKNELYSQNLVRGMNEFDRLYTAYSGKIRNVIERFDIVITELKCERDGLDNYRKNLGEGYRTGKLVVLFGIGLIVLWILAMLGIMKEPMFGRMRGIWTLALAPLIIIVFLCIRYFLKTKKAYENFMDINYKATEQDGVVNNFYFKSQRYSKCIEVLKKRKKYYENILEKLSVGDCISEEDIQKIETMNSKIFNVPEYGFTYREL